jgi:hypothetical protein
MSKVVADTWAEEWKWEKESGGEKRRTRSPPTRHNNLACAACIFPPTPLKNNGTKTNLAGQGTKNKLRKYLKECSTENTTNIIFSTFLDCLKKSTTAREVEKKYVLSGPPL